MTPAPAPGSGQLDASRNRTAQASVKLDRWDELYPDNLMYETTDGTNTRLEDWQCKRLR